MSKFGFTVEFQTGNGDWELAYAGRHWKTEAGASRAKDRYQSDATNYGWHPAMRVIPLEMSYNQRHVPFVTAGQPA